MIKYESPLVSDAVIRQLEGKLPESFTIRKIPMLFRPDFECEDGNDLKNSLSELFENADQMIDEGANVLILSDRGLSEEFAAIPALLASSGLHHHLIKKGTERRYPLSLKLVNLGKYSTLLFFLDMEQI